MTDQTQGKKLADLLFPDVTQRTPDIEARFPPRHLPAGALVTRFAPSPTGFLHIGGVFASLVSERLAHQSGGVFILRIEDTDRKREVEGGVEGIVESLAWVGFRIDEGPCGAGDRGNYGPYRQSQRESIYKVFAKQLVERGLAYPCFCSEEDLEKTRMAQEQAKIKTGYYGKWAVHRGFSYEQIEGELSQGKKFVLRLRSPGDSENKIVFHDRIKGTIQLPENDQDLVILKSDGLPTYHFAHVVDDHFMQTGLVLRGDEWISSIPLHVQLFAIMGWNPPAFAHVSPILKSEGASKRKLSKRKDPEAAMSFYREQGYPPLALIEYLLNLANSSFEDWRKAHRDLPFTEFKVDISDLSLSGALFDIDKLSDIAKDVIGRLDADEVLTNALEWSHQYDPPLHALLATDRDYARRILAIERGGERQRKDIGKWSDVRPYLEYFYDEVYFAKYAGRFVFPEGVTAAAARDIVTGYKDLFLAADDRDSWFGRIKTMSADLGYAISGKEYKKDKTRFKGQLSDVCETIRMVVLGKRNTPDLFECLQALGEARVRARLQAFLTTPGGNEA